MTRSKLHIVLIVLATMAGAAPLTAAEDPRDAPQWPNVATDEPQWPNLAADKLPDPRINPRPSFLDADQVANRILGTGSESPLGTDVTGSTPQWPRVEPEPRISPFAFEPRLSPFAFEIGARYWYSTGQIGFGFSNGSPYFGTPTSTLDWNNLDAHSGEIFGRVDHKPTGMFAKGVVGLGSTFSGEIIDRDFFSGQYKFSDTSSDIKDGKLTFAMFDIGWAYHPVSDIKVGFFAGYHFWRESATAYGVRCNMASVLGCTSAGEVVIGYDVASLRYEPTAHVVRLGFEARFAITDRWSVSGEIVAVPFAAIRNGDSHLLRQDLTDLGPAPNVITTTKYAFGGEAELFFNYAVTPNIELGVGARYWGLVSKKGDVTFGPIFNIADELNSFELQRYGLLVQAKGKF